MERTEETLKARVREAPLTDRLSECRKRIGKMCAEGRAPRMCIPVQHDDDDFFICTTLADAQATVEALQAIIKQMGEQAAVLAKDGMAAKAQVEALQQEVELQETAVRCASHVLDKSRETHNRQAAKIREQQEQLSQLQALVRAAVERWRAQTNVKEGISFRMAMKALEATLDATTLYGGEA